MSQNYTFKGNIVPGNEGTIVGNLLYDELGQLVLAKLNERFRGVKGIELTDVFGIDEPITHSNVPRVLAIDQILREEGLDIHVLSPEEVVRYWDVLPKRDSTNSHTNSVVVYPEEGINEELRKKVLGLVKRKHTKVPLVVSGLGVKKAKNDYGFTFTKTDYTIVKEAPYLAKHCNVIYDSEKDELVQADQGVPIWTLVGIQGGLHCVDRHRGNRLNYWYHNLLDSTSDYGRVQLLSTRGQSI